MEIFATEGEMSKLTSNTGRRSIETKLVSISRLVLFAVLLTCSTGCSIFHPVRGVPASYLPDEFEGPRRGGKRTINPSLLVQTPPDQHRIAAGDVLSIYIPGVLGRTDAEVRQFGVEPPINQPHSPNDPPTIGYPITVRDDHTIALPQVPPINLRNKTLHEAELAIRKAYTQDFSILRPDEAMVLVSLQRARVHRVLVVRQETGNELASGGETGTINIGVSKRGTARVVTLKAYENDVLHALAMEDGVDGLPGLDAENTIYIIRRRAQQFPSQQGHRPLMHQSNASSSQQRVSKTHSTGHSLVQLTSLAEKNAHSNELVVRGQSPVVTADYRTAAHRGFARNQNIRQVGHSFQTAQVPPSPLPVQQSTSQLIPPTSNYQQPQGHLQFPPQYRPAHSGHSLPQSSEAGQFSPGLILPPPSLPSIPQQHLPVQQMPVQQYQQEPGMTPPVMDSSPHWSTLLNDFDPTIDNPNVVRIPIRLAPGEQPNISEEMITLEDGDIVFIESRETDVIYTGGLLGGGQYTLPREYDLGVLEAISIAEGRSNGGGGNSRSIGGVSALNRDVSVSASRLIILRTLPATGQRITVEVNLHKAMKYQEENILVQPGDMLILQYTALESIAAITQRYLLEGALFGLAAAQLNTSQ
jgi:hypothetical protein